ncbi:putative DNA topoisomerase 3-alpha-like [Capsicum annuum]|nr:putative DNA topoisomerase 3-alpha-like [Capsicum annuum]KAF3682873.1 putative DNA topoisomerase 3-alpha-like [Capsicum annuum]
MPIETMAPVAAPTPTPAAAAAPPAGAAPATNNEAQKKSNRIQVSNTKKPLFFYVNLAKRYMQQHNEVELSALGMAITTVVTVAEILKNGGFATEKKVLTSTVGMKDEAKGRMVQKARVMIDATWFGPFPMHILGSLLHRAGLDDDEKFVNFQIEIVLTKSEKFDKLMTPNNNNNSERAAAQDGAATNKNTNTNDTKEQTKK